MALGKSKLGKDKSKDRPKRSRLNLGDVVPDAIRQQAQQTKADVSGMATYLIIQGLKTVADGSADDVQTYLTDTDNFAFLYGWDYTVLDEEAQKILEKLNN